MRVERIEEFQIPLLVHQAIADMLRESFPEYPEGRSFLKQLPDFRLLAWDEDHLIAHMGVEHRLISNSAKLLRIFGIADLCVATEHQNQKVATRLILELETLAQIYGIDFLMLFAKDHELYLANGFELVQNDCQWLMIQGCQTLGITHRKVADSLMIKSLGGKPWEDGLVDFLGHVF